MHRNIVRRSAVLWLVLAAACGASGAQAALDQASAPEDVGMSSERLARLTRALEAYVDEGRLAGSVTLIARRGRIAYLHASGERDREADAPMGTDSIFRIASQTKAIVTVGALALVEQGKLLIGDPVSNYLPEFRDTTVAVPAGNGGYEIVKARRPITIRDLLTHTSGFDYGTGLAEDRWEAAGIQGWYFAERDEPIRDTVARIASLPAQAQPGERWIYGYNTDILGALIEAVSGQPLDEFLRVTVFEPLGMGDTHFYLPAGKRDRLAAVYASAGNGLQRAPDAGAAAGSSAPTLGVSSSQGAYVDGPRKSFSGGAGLLSTATDYARFLQMLLNGGELDGRRVLGRKTVELMTVDHLGGIAFRPGEGFGLGVSVLEDVGVRGTPGSAGEFGWGGAYHSTYWVDPREELVVVYLTQLLPAPPELDDQAKVRALVYQAIAD